MLHPRARRFWCGVASAALVVAAWAYVAPALGAIRPNSLWASLDDSVVTGPLARSLAVASGASVLCVAIGLVLAVVLREVPLGSRSGSALALLMLPVLVGDLVTGFAFKSVATEGDWFVALFGDRPPWAVLGTMVAMQIWQYGLLCTYLFWLRIVSIEQSLADFAEVSGLSRIEFVRDILWPRCSELAIVLLLMSFFAAAHETAKSWLVFKVSPGTGTSLVSHALWEQYQHRVPVNARFAQHASLQDCGVAAIAILLGAVVLAGTVYAIATAVVHVMTRATATHAARRPDRPASTPARRRSTWLVAAVVAATIGPIVAPAFVFPLSTSIEWVSTIKAAGMAGAGAAFAVFVAALFAFLLRLTSPAGFARFTWPATAVLFVIMALRSVPPLAFILSGYDLFAHVSNSQAMLVGSWFVGQALLALPLLGAFGVWLHTQVTQRELEFQEGAGLSLRELAQASFLRRFRLDYAFLFLFAWSVVWNESTLNRVVSDSVPTFIDLLSRNLSARPDFSRAATLCLLSVCIGLATVTLWLLAQSGSYRSRGRA